MHIRTPEARAADLERLAWLEAGDHARVIDTMPEFLRYKPEAMFGHYLMMVGAIGGRDCVAPGVAVQRLRELDRHRPGAHLVRTPARRLDQRRHPRLRPECRTRIEVQHSDGVNLGWSGSAVAGDRQRGEHDDEGGGPEQRPDGERPAESPSVATGSSTTHARTASTIAVIGWLLGEPLHPAGHRVDRHVGAGDERQREHEQRHALGGLRRPATRARSG